MLWEPAAPKGEIKASKWIEAYEDWNVDCGLAAGLPSYAQIGKGTAIPGEMGRMLVENIGHPSVGTITNCHRPALNPLPLGQCRFSSAAAEQQTEGFSQRYSDARVADAQGILGYVRLIREWGVPRFPISATWS